MTALDRMVGKAAGVLAILCIIGLVAFLALLLYKPAGDRSDLDYHRYAKALERVSVQLNQNATEDFIDLADLNHGDWTTACLFGGYTSPGKVMAKYGANISEFDQTRMTEATGLRMFPVEEFEASYRLHKLPPERTFCTFRHGHWS